MESARILSRYIKERVLSENEDLRCMEFEAALDKAIDEAISLFNFDDSFYAASEVKLKDAMDSLKMGDSSEESIAADLQNIKELSAGPGNNPGDNESSEEQYGRDIIETEEEIVCRREELLQIWEKMIKSKNKGKRLDQICDEFNKTIEGWLKLLRVSTSARGGPSFAWGTSPGDFTLKDIERIEELALLYKDDENVRKLTDMLGRKSGIDMSFDDISIGSGMKVKNKDSKEEISGLELGHDIENIVPSELSLLQDTELSILFDLKFVENRLLSFSKEGYSDLIEEEGGQFHVDEGEIGPIILIVDTSGSMTFHQSKVKALVYTIVCRAADQKRKVFKIDFNTITRSIDLSPENSIKNLLEFMDSAFNGGTDIRPAIYEAIRVADDECYRNADILVMSDFFLDDAVLNRGGKAFELKSRGIRFHSIIFGNPGFDADVFDTKWIFSRKTIRRSDD